MLALLRKWWPSILAAAAALWGVFGTQIQAAVAAHPELSAVLAAVAVILTHLLPSPVASSTASGIITAKVDAPTPKL